MRNQKDRKLKLYRGTWCVVWTDEHGKTKRHSLRTKCRDTAERNHLEYTKQLQYSGDTVSDIIDQWLEEKKNLKSMGNILGRIHNIKKFFGHYYPDQINRPLCRAYGHFRQVSNTTVKNELSILRCAIRWNNPQTKAIFELPAPNAPRDIRITKDEYKTLLKHANSPHIKLFVILAIATAGRVSALLELTWDRVNFEKKQIQLSTGDHKNKRRALVPMTENLREALEEAYIARTSDYVIEYGSKKINSIRKGFKETAKKAGLDHISPHVLRHSAASWMAEGGIPMAEIAQYLGHTNPSITYKVYARYSPDYLREAASVLDI